jgi:hypothetical protein
LKSKFEVRLWRSELADALPTYLPTLTFELPTFTDYTGWLSSKWEASENNRRAKYYTLTKAGMRRLGEATEQWNRVALAMTKALTCR